MPGVVLGAALTFQKHEVIILVSCLVTMAVCLWLIGGYLRQLSSRRNTNMTVSETSSQTDSKSYLSKHFGLKLSATAVVFLGVIDFLIVSSYGSLMIELSQKILDVIG
jgi:hypothetical protein